MYIFNNLLNMYIVISNAFMRIYMLLKSLVYNCLSISEFQFEVIKHFLPSLFIYDTL